MVGPRKTLGFLKHIALTAIAVTAVVTIGMVSGVWVALGVVAACFFLPLLAHWLLFAYLTDRWWPFNENG
jgi:heme/copper-type cytochrome/quinol oxidase subunit 4